MHNLDWTDNPGAGFYYRGDMLAEEIMGVKKSLIEVNPLETSTWQSQEADKHPEMQPLEWRNVIVSISIPEWEQGVKALLRPNLPWAEDHFQERIGGKPVNPPPSQAWWPYAQVENAEHKHGTRFSHTYPERMWPKTVNAEWEYNSGLRYDLGDLNDIVSLMKRDRYTRQAYLPIWFPEDTGSVEGQRVPCTLGYHFMIRPNKLGGDELHVNYFMRSCDIMRHFVDDLYMAARLGQWVRDQVEFPANKGELSLLTMGELTMFISSLHLFKGDIPIVKAQQKLWTKTEGRGFTHAATWSK